MNCYRHVVTMDELELIAESLRQQRKALDDVAESTSTRTSETAALLEKIEELRVRAERTNREHPAQTRQGAK